VAVVLTGAVVLVAVVLTGAVVLVAVVLTGAVVLVAVEVTGAVVLVAVEVTGAVVFATVVAAPAAVAVAVAVDAGPVVWTSPSACALVTLQKPKSATTRIVAAPNLLHCPAVRQGVVRPRPLNPANTIRSNTVSCPDLSFTHDYSRRSNP
jgi:hypothetical protein